MFTDPLDTAGLQKVCKVLKAPQCPVFIIPNNIIITVLQH